MPDAPPPRPPRIPPHERFDRPVEFVRHDLKTPLWGKQAQILRAIKRNRRTAVRSCNGSGKTFVAATAVIWWLMAHPNDPAMVVTTAPTQHQVRDLLWREIRSIIYRNPHVLTSKPEAANNRSSLPSREGVRGWVQSEDATMSMLPATSNFTPKLTQTTLELSPNHYATGLSTDSPERFQGFHETNILFVVDEASGVREEVFDAIEGSMTSRRARLLLIGNPTSLAGTFYKAFHQRRTQYKTIHISAFDTPNLTNVPTPAEGPSAGMGAGLPFPPSLQGRELEGGFNRQDENIPVVETDAQSQPDLVEHSREAAQVPPQTGHHKPIPGILTQQWVEEASTTWSQNSAQYQVRVLGEFPTQANDTLIPLTHIEAALSPNKQSNPTPAHRADERNMKDLSSSRPTRRDLTRPTQTPTPQSEPTDVPTPAEGPSAVRGSGVQLSHPDLTQPIHTALASPAELARVPSAASARPDLTQPISIGVDIARFGTDRTVICIRQGNHVLALNQHQKLNTMRTTGLIVDAIHKYNPHVVNIDEIGIGAGVLDRLHELGYRGGAGSLPRNGGELERGRTEPSRSTTSATNAKTVVHGVNVGTRATDPEHFFNLRSELYDNLRSRFEQEEIKIPNDDDLIGQLAAIRVEYTSRGQLKVEPKETMRRRSLPSPDKADALLLAFAPTPERTAFEVWV